MKQTIDEKENIRNRTLDRVETLAASYTPEWKFDRDNPDIGTAIAMVYADQSVAVGEAKNRITDRFHREFVNFLDLSLLPAKPAKSIVLLNLTSETIPGAYIPKGTKLAASDMVSGTQDTIFETEQSLFVTSATIQDIFMSDTKSGKIIPIKGFYDMPGLLGQKESDGEDGPEDGSYQLMAPPMSSFTLFGEHDGIGDNIMIFYHPSVFDIEDSPIYMRIEDGPEVYQGILDGTYTLFYYNDYEIFSPVDEISEYGDGKTLVIKKSLSCGKLGLEDREYSVFAIYANDPIRNVVTARGFSFASSGVAVPAEVVTDSRLDRDVSDFLPFTDTLNLYSEIYIGHDQYFSKSGSKATIKFDLSFEECRIDIPRQEEDTKLTIIKRKPKTAAAEIPTNVYVDEITLEYYNGIGWTRLDCDQMTSGLLSGSDGGERIITFTVPDDWQQSTMSAYESRFLRIRLIRSDNCYLRPAIHYCPRIRDLSISFTYEESYAHSSRTLRISGSDRRDVTLESHQADGAEPLVVFQPSKFTEDSLYIGFSKRPADGPVSLFFNLMDDQRFSGLKCRFEYSRGDGFVNLKVLDHTENFTKSGTVFFIPQPDWTSTSIEERRRFWIRITRIDNSTDESALPSVGGVLLNAVEVANTETHPPQEFFMEEAVPDMSFTVPQTNILSADVWVNEFGLYSQNAMRLMEQNDPDNIRSESDINNRITAFYVRWHEVDSFATAEDRRCFVLDRMNRQIIFGDGLKTDFPRVVDNIAFTVQIKSCLGRAGNVPAGSIVAPVGNLIHIGEVNNPIKAFGGSDMETMEAALERGADILHSRDRLITAADYERACQRFSDDIDQVRCLIADDASGLGISENDVAMILLMTDFESGSYSFHRTEAPLREYICSRCEITLPDDNIKILEPVFVSISCDIWGEVVDMDESFELQPMINDLLDEYLNPVKGAGTGGWRIGTLPKVSQIQMRLGNLKSRMILRKIFVSASWTDADGYHETDLSKLEVMPYMACRSGEHKVHLTQG